MAMPAGIFSCNNRDWGKRCEGGSGCCRHLVGGDEGCW